MTIHIQQRYDTIHGTGGVVWAAGVELAHFIRSIDLHGKTVLELGAGTGLISMVAAKLGMVARNDAVLLN